MCGAVRFSAGSVMKFLKLILFIFSLLLIFIVSKGQTREESILYTESHLAMKKKAMILNYFQFTEAEKSCFWPLYNTYTRHIHHYEMEYYVLVNKLDKGIGKLDPRDLQDLTERLIQNDLEVARLRKQYYRRFKHALTPRKASEFMQLDNTFRTMIRLEMQKDPAPFELLAKEVYSKNEIKK